MNHFHALRHDYGATLFVCYLLSQRVHQRPLRASYREISCEMNRALSYVGVHDAAVRLAEQGLLQFTPGRRGGKPSQFGLLLEPLALQISQTRAQAPPCLMSDASERLPVLMHSP